VQGFVHSSNIWQSGKLIWPEVMKSAFGFGKTLGAMCENKIGLTPEGY
jgi:hypothetical protein